MKSYKLIPKQPLPKWKWINCNMTVFLEKDDKLIYQPLVPNYRLFDQNSTNSIENKLKMRVRMEKSFNFSEKIGWHWHKSWKLPILWLSTQFILPSYIKARLLVVIPIQDDSAELYLKQILIEGDNIIQLGQDQLFTFQSLKFVETSYKHDGSRFHILIQLFTTDPTSQQDIIFKGIISPPIFVDSRKSARDTYRLSYLKVVSQVQPFPSFLLKKDLFKRNAQVQQMIDNSFEGFFNYILAQNIRNKIRHPLFLSMKFSNVFDLFILKPPFYQNNSTTDQLVLHLQQQLVQQTKERFRRKQSLTSQVPLTCLLVKNHQTADKKQLKLCIDQIQSTLVSVFYERSEINERYKEAKIDELKYRQIVNQMKALTIQELQQFKEMLEISDDEGFSEISNSESSCQEDEDISQEKLDVKKMQWRSQIQVQPIKKEHQLSVQEVYYNDEIRKKIKIQENIASMQQPMENMNQYCMYQRYYGGYM